MGEREGESKNKEKTNNKTKKNDEDDREDGCLSCFLFVISEALTGRLSCSVSLACSLI